MSMNCLVGQVCTSIYENYPENFTFKFGNPPDDFALCVDCLWRIVVNRQVIRTSLDHGHQFGLPAPIDAYSEARKFLHSKRVVAVDFSSGLVDVTLEFEGGILLELIQEHSGYEPWNFVGPGIHLVATGSGQIFEFSS